MSDINTTKSSFIIIQRPKTAEQLIIPERKFEDKKFRALSTLKFNGEVVEKGTVFKFLDVAVYEHFKNFGAIEEVL